MKNRSYFKNSAVLCYEYGLMTSLSHPMDVNALNTKQEFRDFNFIFYRWESGKEISTTTELIKKKERDQESSQLHGNLMLPATGC